MWNAMVEQLPRLRSVAMENCHKMSTATISLLDRAWKEPRFAIAIVLYKKLPNKKADCEKSRYIMEEVRTAEKPSAQFGAVRYQQ